MRNVLLSSTILIVVGSADARLVVMRAQSAAPPTLAFEVASIKLTGMPGGKKVGAEPPPKAAGGVLTPQGNRFTARNASLLTLIRFAYGERNVDGVSVRS